MKGRPGLSVAIGLTFAGEISTILAVSAVMVTLLAVVSPLAAPLNSVGSFDTTNVLWAGLLFVVYVCGQRRPVTTAQLRARGDRRQRMTTVRIEASFRVLAADKALTLDATFQAPATIDALIATLDEEESR